MKRQNPKYRYGKVKLTPGRLRQLRALAKGCGATVSEIIEDAAAGTLADFYEADARKLKANALTFAEARYCKLEQLTRSEFISQKQLRTA